MAFKYVSGAPIKNAVGYNLHKTNSAGTSLKVLATKNSRQDFHNVGAITVSGTLAQPSVTAKSIRVGGTTPEFPSSIQIYPITKFTVDGPKYYFKVSGQMDVILTNDTSSFGVDFGGIYDELNSTTPVTVGFTNGQHLYEDNGKFYLKLNLTNGSTTTEIDIKVFESSGDVPVRSVSLSLYDGHRYVAITSADDRYKHTDFIEIAALADSVVKDGQLYCVGNLNEPGLSTVCVVAFYSAMKYDTCITTYTWDQLQKAMHQAENRQYLTTSEIKEYLAPKDANYVIFTSSSDLEGEDQVGVGIYFPLYGQYPDLKSGDYVAVEAVGDGFIYANSKLSEPEQYIE